MLVLISGRGAAAADACVNNPVNTSSAESQAERKPSSSAVLFMLYCRPACSAPKTFQEGRCRATLPTRVHGLREAVALRPARATSCSCRGAHAVKASQACRRAEQIKQQITSSGGTSRSGTAAACLLLAFRWLSSRAEGPHCWYAGWAGLSAAHILAVTPVLAWLLLPDAASAEGLIPMGVFQSWLVCILQSALSAPTEAEATTDFVSHRGLTTSNAHADRD